MLCPGRLAQEPAEVPLQGSRDSRQGLLETEDNYEGEHPPPNPSANAATPRIARCPQPQGVAYTRPAECPELAPREDQDEHELPDQPQGQENQQRLS